MSSSGASKAQAPEHGWVTDWDEQKPSSLAGHAKSSRTETPRAFSPAQSQNLDDFLQSSSAGKHKQNPSQTGRCACLPLYFYYAAYQRLCSLYALALLC